MKCRRITSCAVDLSLITLA